MQESLRPLLEIQELDIKMIRLMRLQKQRQRELEQIESLKSELKHQLDNKQLEVHAINDEVSSLEKRIVVLNEKLKSLESKQSAVKKVEEFNALTQEMTALERERISLEHQISNLVDKRVLEEDIREKISHSLKASDVSSQHLENEIKVSIEKINEEGLALRKDRDEIVQHADHDLLKIYERLLRNKKDRVIVPIENRTCSGCHIALTAQHENLVRKGSNLVFCEHCSRIHYWQESESLEGSSVATKRRRRKPAVTA
ncbi:MAG: zinc ribbon domain-containing protein [Chlamydiota bacterium]